MHVTGWGGGLRGKGHRSGVSSYSKNSSRSNKIGVGDGGECPTRYGLPPACLHRLSGPFLLLPRRRSRLALTFSMGTPWT